MPSVRLIGQGGGFKKLNSRKNRQVASGRDAASTLKIDSQNLHTDICLILPSKKASVRGLFLKFSQLRMANSGK
jgi:hypothetical protein